MISLHLRYPAGLIAMLHSARDVFLRCVSCNHFLSLRSHSCTVKRYICMYSKARIASHMRQAWTGRRHRPPTSSFTPASIREALAEPPVFMTHPSHRDDDLAIYPRNSSVEKILTNMILGSKEARTAPVPSNHDQINDGMRCGGSDRPPGFPFNPGSSI